MLNVYVTRNTFIPITCTLESTVHLLLNQHESKTWELYDVILKVYLPDNVINVTNAGFRMERSICIIHFVLRP